MLFAAREPRLKRLLIVEDEPLIAFDTEHFLVGHGYFVVATLDNAPAAQAEIAGGGIDLILADVNLNASSGRDVALTAKAAGIPVLFVTANCPVDACDMSIGSLIKPFSQKDLKLAIEAIEAHLDGARSRKTPRGLTLYN